MRNLLVLLLAFHAVTARADNTLTVQTRFEKGRQEAIKQLGTVRACSMNPATALEIKTWILRAKEAMLADLDATPHDLVQSEEPACAATQAGEAVPVKLSVPVCVRDHLTDRQAAETLLRMSARHLGVDQDRRAALIAQGILDATGSCLTDIQLLAGSDHTCLLKGGKVDCFGRNDKGQTNVPELTNAKLIALGITHSCALDSFGVKCWGDNSQNQLNVPGLWNVRKIAAAGSTTCAIHEDGLQCWGYSNNFLLSFPRNTRNPRELAMGSSQACVLDDSGMRCWGSGFSGSVPVIPTTAHSLSVGNGFGCVRDAAQGDKFICWGYDNVGQATPPVMDGLRSYDLGAEFGCAVLPNRVRCWGANNEGQATPAQLLNPRLVSAGYEHACALDDVGVRCWGANDAKQLDVPTHLQRIEQ